MTTVKVDFDGSADGWIAAMRKMQGEIRQESAERRKADQVSKELSRSEQDRFKMLVKSGQESKRIMAELGQESRDAMLNAVDPVAAYVQQLETLEGQLKADSLSLEDFKAKKSALNVVMDLVHKSQQAENQELAEAAKLVKATETATERYEQKLKALDLALSRETITAKEHARTVGQAQADLAADLRSTDTVAQELSRSEQERFRMTVKNGTEAKRVMHELGTEALAAMAKAADPVEEYVRQLMMLEDQLKRDAVSLEEFKRKKLGLAGAMKAAEEAQAAENTELMEAAKLVAQAETNLSKYEQKIRLLNSALKKGKIDQDQYSRAVTKAKLDLEQADNGTKNWVSTLGSTAGQLVGVTGAVGAMGLAVAQLRAEYDRLIERQKLARDQNVTLAAAQEDAISNLGEDPNMNATQLFTRLRQSSGELGVKEVDLTKAASIALSAKGDQSAETAIQSVEAAAKLRKFNPEEIPVLAGSALDISKETGKGLEESLGSLMDVGTISRITKLGALAENVTPAITGAMKFGTSFEFAGATMGAISQGMVDTKGQASGTAEISLMKQLRAFQPEQNVEKTFAQMVQNPAMKAQFLKPSSEGGFGATFEAKALPTIEALLTSNTTINRQFMEAFQKLRTSDGQQRFDNTVAERDALASSRIAMVAQGLGNAGDQAMLADGEAAMSGAIREGLKELQMGLGESDLNSKLSGLSDDFASGGVRQLPDLIRKLENTQSSLLNPVKYVSAGMGAPAVAIPRNPTEVERKQAVVVGDVLEQFKAVQAGMEGVAVQKGNRAAEVGPVRGEFTKQLDAFGSLPGGDREAKRQGQTAFEKAVQRGDDPFAASAVGLRAATANRGGESLSADDQQQLQIMLKELDSKATGRRRPGEAVQPAVRMEDLFGAIPPAVDFTKPPEKPEKKAAKAAEDPVATVKALQAAAGRGGGLSPEDQRLFVAAVKDLSKAAAAMQKAASVAPGKEKADAAAVGRGQAVARFQGRRG